MALVSLSLGAFNPVLEDPLPGQLKKQLVLRIISGQQLPKPKDSMLGDRGEVTASSFSFFLTSLFKCDFIQKESPELQYR